MAKMPQSWGPFRQLTNFQRQFDELFDRFLETKWRPADSPRALPVESYIEGDQLIIRADLPGVDPKDVEITVAGGMLKIAGRREPSREPEKQGRVGQKHPYKRFERTLTLPPDVTPEQIKASYRNGVLELRVPLSTKAGARKVTVRVDDE